MLNTDQNRKALYQAQACWYLKSLTTSRISAESYKHSLHWYKKHDCWQSDKSSLVKQSSLISRSDKSNWHSRSSARSSARSSNCYYVWTVRTDEYRLNSTWTVSVWMSWEILNLIKIL